VDLYQKYRPKRFKDVVGQTNVVKMLLGMVKRNKVPNSILFSGPSGSGKTTIARILAKKVGCSDHDLSEIKEKV
jgi:DNA polymerase-3 subunit gamma/tau